MTLSVPTDLAPPFAWEGDHVAVDLGAGARGLFTTRRGGASEGPYASLNLGRWTDDDLAAIEANWRRLWSLTGERLLLVGRQVHGATVARLRRDDDERPPEADGQAASYPGGAVMVLTADCLPVLLAADGAVAAVHAGWRGLAAGVLEEGVAALRDVGGRGAVTAAIGPAACGRCYEVRDDVRAALGEPPVGGPAPIDLKEIARRRLEAAKVTVHDVGLCTMCSPRELFFSHRADGGVTGRQTGVAWLA
jgi:polyphenol oxidase